MNGEYKETEDSVLGHPNYVETNTSEIDERADQLYGNLATSNGMPICDYSYVNNMTVHPGTLVSRVPLVPVPECSNAHNFQPCQTNGPPCIQGVHVPITAEMVNQVTGVPLHIPPESGQPMCGVPVAMHHMVPVNCIPPSTVSHQVMPGYHMVHSGAGPIPVGIPNGSISSLHTMVQYTQAVNTATLPAVSPVPMSYSVAVQSGNGQQDCTDGSELCAKPFLPEHNRNGECSESFVQEVKTSEAETDALQQVNKNSVESANRAAEITGDACSLPEQTMPGDNVDREKDSRITSVTVADDNVVAGKTDLETTEKMAGVSGTLKKSGQIDKDLKPLGTEEDKKGNSTSNMDGSIPLDTSSSPASSASKPTEPMSVEKPKPSWASLFKSSEAKKVIVPTEEEQLEAAVAESLQVSEKTSARQEAQEYLEVPEKIIVKPSQDRSAMSLGGISKLLFLYRKLCRTHCLRKHENLKNINNIPV